MREKGCTALARGVQESSRRQESRKEGERPDSLASGLAFHFYFNTTVKIGSPDGSFDSRKDFSHLINSFRDAQIGKHGAAGKIIGRLSGPQPFVFVGFALFARKARPPLSYGMIQTISIMGAKNISINLT